MRKRRTGVLWMLLALLLAGVGYYYWQQSRSARQDAAPGRETPPPVTAQAEPEAPAPPAIKYPVPARGADDKPAEPLPELDKSDSKINEALAGLIGGDPLTKILRNENIVRHVVVTIDNLPRKRVAQRLLPVNPAEGKIATEKTAGGFAIADKNDKRYAPFVSIVEKTDANRLVSIYTDLYPLFQSAYRDLGYPEGYFNDRLVEVIDHMLEAPAPAGPILLRQPHILYEFADPALENSSAGHKLMIRLGPDNAQTVKKKLREIRQILTKEPPLQ